MDIEMVVALILMIWSLLVVMVIYPYWMEQKLPPIVHRSIKAFMENPDNVESTFGAAHGQLIDRISMALGVPDGGIPSLLESSARQMAETVRISTVAGVKGLLGSMARDAYGSAEGIESAIAESAEESLSKAMVQLPNGMVVPAPVYAKIIERYPMAGELIQMMPNYGNGGGGMSVASAPIHTHTGGNY